MSRQITSSVLAGVTIGILLGCSAPALAQLRMAVAERYKNNSGVPARCLRKIIYNYAIVGQPQSDEFAICTKRTVSGYTVIECTGGVVQPDGTARVAFVGTATSRRAEVICAKWYTDAACTAYPYYAEPVPFVRIDDVFNMTVEHGAQEWTDPDGPPGPALGTIYGDDVQYAIADYFLPLEDLNEELFTSISWTDMNGCDFELASLGVTASCDLGAIDENDVVLFRFYTGPSGTDNYELVQFRLGELNIPTVSEWGLVAMTLLGLTAGTIVFMRRRAMAA